MSGVSGNKVKSALALGQVSLGSWIQIGHPAVAELLALAGYDWLAVDMEHTDIGIQECTALFRAMHGRGALPFARVRENDTLAIRQVLDAGAMGIIVPLVNSAAEAEKAVRAAKFPPRGVRGTAFFRANNYGGDFASYMENADRDILVIVMIETKEAVGAIDEILAVDGIDGVFIGPYDLSLSYGIPGQLGDPVMVAAKAAVLGACAKAGKAAGIHEVKLAESEVTSTIAGGFTFIALGMDNVFLEAGARKALSVGRSVVASMAKG